MRASRSVVYATLFLFASMSTLVRASDDPPDPQRPAPFKETVTVNPERPKALNLFYVGYGALQVGDIVTTQAGLASGGQEKNPLMQGVAGSTMKLSLVKLAVTALTVYSAESLWRQGHRKGAIIAMVVASGAAGYVMAHNMRVRAQMNR